MLWLVVRRLSESATGRRAALTIAICFLCFGVTTYALVVSRPDQFLVLVLTLLVVLPILVNGIGRERPWRQAHPVRWTLAAGFAYLLALSVAAFAHPNLVYYTPLVLASVYLTFRPAGRAVVGLVGLTCVAMIALGLAQGTRILWTCNDPVLAAMINQRVVDIHALATNAPAATLTLATNALSGLDRLLQWIVFGDAYQSDWLPPTHGLGKSVIAGAIGFGIHVAWYSAVIGGIAVIIQLIATGQARHHLASLVLASAMLISLAGQAAHNQNFNFTLVELMLPLLALFCVLTLTPFVERAMRFRVWPPMLWSIIALAVASVLICMATITPRLAAAAASGKIFNEHQHHSYSIWNGKERAASAARLAKACNITPGQAPDLVIDDVSYFTFRRDRRPMFAPYVDPNLTGAALKGRLRRFLVERDSSGFVGKCNYVPWELMSLAIRDGEVCCISRAALRGDGE
jgi:hypothetical protein